MPNSRGDDEVVGRLRSASSTDQSFVTFLNTTSRDVDIIWINFDGLQVKYKTLGPNNFCDVNTFVNHPWIFRDSNSKVKLNGDYQEVYKPKCWKETVHFPILVPIRPRRVIVKITIPVYPLKNRCLEIVKMQLKRTEDALKLDIPKALQQELLRPLA